MKTELPKKSKEHEAMVIAIRDRLVEKHADKIAIIVLFGSFSRGDWVYDYYHEEDGSAREYASDYDLLIITKNNKNGTEPQSLRLTNKFRKTLSDFCTLNIRHKPSIIIESPKRVNEALEKGQYFFTDIKEEGILLYDSGDIQLAEPRELTLEEKRQLAQDYYDQWFKSGSDFLPDIQNAVKDERYKNAAFYLHQSTEHLFNCTLLVISDYKPKLHDLAELLKRITTQKNTETFFHIFPQNTKEETTCFELLCKAYIGARYDKHYTITKEQLEYLIQRVETLQTTVKKACEEHIQSLK